MGENREKEPDEAKENREKEPYADEHPDDISDEETSEDLDEPIK